VIRQALRRVWSLPWPEPMRQAAPLVLRLPLIRQIALPHFMVGVVGVIRNDAGEVLMLHHTYRGNEPWGLPTGFMEHGEQPRDALVREIAEETGYDVRLDATAHVYALTDRPLLNIVYTGRYVAGTFRPSDEISEARFVAPEALPALGADHDILSELLRP